MQKTVRFEIDGKNYEVGVERVGDRLTLTHEGKRYVVTLLPEQPAWAAPSPPRGSSGLSFAPASAAAPQVSTAAAVQGPSPAEPDSAGVLYAPMTGIIKEIRVAPGHNVEGGQVVLIMEAMKMDIDVPSPASGVVAEVLVKVGDTVNAKQQLVVIH
jgi:biotin carboxyl carrier protein